MIISRIKQGLVFIFGRYRAENDVLVKKILTEEEFDIFKKMSEYDKIHSFNLYLSLRKNKVLKNDEDYLKLALLHDCGKDDFPLWKRIKKVVVGDESVEKHPEKSFEKLKSVNKTVAELAYLHHKTPKDEKMKIFQQLDDGK